MEIRPTARKSNLLHEMVAMSAGWLRQGHTPINVTAHAIARAAVERPLQSHAPRAQAEPAVFVEGRGAETLKAAGVNVLRIDSVSYEVLDVNAHLPIGELR